MSSSKSIFSFFSVRSNSSAASSSQPVLDNSSDSDSEPPPAKKGCREKCSSLTSQRKYRKDWEKEFKWLEYDQDVDGAFCQTCRTYNLKQTTQQHTRGVCVSKPYQNWKKAVSKMREHQKSAQHITCTEAMIMTSTQGSVVQHIQRISISEREKNRAALKSLVRCTHFLTRHHIAHSTNFTQLVDLVVSCGARELQAFLEAASKNAAYTSRGAVVEFIQALSMWTEELLLERLHKVPFFSIMGDECTDVSVIEELSIFCRWEENGVAVESFLEILPLKKTDAETIYTAIIDCLRSKGLQVSNIIGMGFDGAAAFSGKKTGVQARLKKHAPHSVFVHCHCHMLQLACVQAANSTPGIKHVYTALTTLWKYFHYSPKRAESLKEIQKILELPEMKVIKPSDTRWLSHERCVKAVKANYCALILTFSNNYQNFGEPEALGLQNILSKFSTVVSIYLLDYVLPITAKLSKTLQSKQIDLSMISALVDASIRSIDDAITPAANWILEILSDKDDIEQATGETIDTSKLLRFQETVATPFVNTLKQNISRRFEAHDIISAMSIFDPQKVPSSDSTHLPTYGSKSIEVLTNHYAQERLCLTLDKEKFKEKHWLPLSSVQNGLLFVLSS